MTRSKRLEPIARVADRHEQDAAGRFAESRESLVQQRQRLEEMRSYREEYLGRLAKQGGGGLRASQIKEYQVFLARLDDTIGQLEGMVHAAERAMEQRRNEWLGRRARSKALDGVVDRYRREEDRDSLRREERESDERNQRRS